MRVKSSLARLGLDFFVLAKAKHTKKRAKGERKTAKSFFFFLLTHNLLIPLSQTIARQTEPIYARAEQARLLMAEHSTLTMTWHWIFSGTSSQAQVVIL